MDNHEVWGWWGLALFLALAFHGIPWALGFTGDPGDLFNYHIPVWIFQKSSLLSGHYPLWMPFLNGGQPHAADPGNMFMYPPNFLCLFAMPNNTPVLFFILHVTWAGFGMNLWLKSFGGGRWARVVGMVLYVGSGFAFLERVHPTIWAAYAWIPWVMASLERWIQNPYECRKAFQAGLCAALFFLAGNPQLLVGLFYFALTYAVVGLCLKAREKRDHLTQAAKTLPWFIAGALPALVLLIAFWEFKAASPRQWLASDYLGFNAVGSVRLRDLDCLVFGWTSGFSPGWHLPSVAFAEAGEGLVGVWVPFLALWALRRPSRRAALWVVFFFGLGGVALALGSNTPVHAFICRWVPGFSMFRGAFRYLFLWTTASSFLAALGAETLIERLKTGGRWREEVPGAAIYLFVLGTASLWVKPFPAWEMAVLSVGAVVLLFSASGRVGIARIAAVLALGLPVIVLSYGAPRGGHGDLYEYEKGTPFLDVLRNQTDGRVFLGDKIPYAPGRTTKSLPPDAAIALGIRNVGGYTPMTIDRSLETKKVSFKAYQSLWAVQGFLTGNDHGSVGGYSKSEEGGAYFYRALKPAAPAYAPRQIQWVPTAGSALALMQGKDFDPYETSYLAGVSAPRPHVFSPLKVERVARGTDREEWRIEKSKPGWVVFTEVDFPGWRATVDDRTAAIWNANSNFRALWVAEGDHRVVFEYRPTWLGAVGWILGFWLAAAAWLWRPKGPGGRTG